MLKIKDNVDLEELKKFGFYKNDWSDGGYSYTVPDINNSGRCKVDIHANKFGYLALEMYESSFGLQVPTILFDLIQAGLVEKV